MAKSGGGSGRKRGGGGGGGWRDEVLRTVGQSGRLNWSKITRKQASRVLSQSHGMPRSTFNRLWNIAH